MNREWPKIRSKRCRSPRTFLPRFRRQSTVFLAALEQGYTEREAADLAGPSLWTFQRWYAAGHPTLARLGVDDHFIEFRKKWGTWKRQTRS